MLCVWCHGAKLCRAGASCTCIRQGLLQLRGGLGMGRKGCGWGGVMAYQQLPCPFARCCICARCAHVQTDLQGPVEE